MIEGEIILELVLVDIIREKPLQSYYRGFNLMDFQFFLKFLLIYRPTY